MSAAPRADRNGVVTVQAPGGRKASFSNEGPAAFILGPCAMERTRFFRRSFKSRGNWVRGEFLLASFFKIEDGFRRQFELLADVVPAEFFAAEQDRGQRIALAERELLFLVAVSEVIELLIDDEFLREQPAPCEALLLRKKRASPDWRVLQRPLKEDRMSKLRLKRVGEQRVMEARLGRPKQVKFTLDHGALGVEVVGGVGPLAIQADSNRLSIANARRALTIGVKGADSIKAFRFQARQ